MPRQINILILEDNPLDAELVQRELRRAGLDFTAQLARDKTGFISALDLAVPDLLLADYALPGFSGMDALALARERFADIPVIIVSGAIGEEVALETLKRGATDYVLKQRLGRLGQVAGRALEEARLVREKTRVDEELKRSNENLEQFAYVASHDLQEPLRQMSNYAGLLERRYKGKLDADADVFLGYIVDGGKRLQNLINDLLAFSRIGQERQNFAEVDCNAVLALVLDNMLTSIKESGAEITHDELPVLTANKTNFVQLFQNLIGNALKFRGAQPPRIHVKAAREGAYWRFSVQDNGIGIDPQHKERVFVIFQRLRTVEKLPGTGIGLSICKKIVETHGGRIWLESEPGKGTTFYFTVPAAGVPENAAGPVHEMSGSTTRAGTR